MTTKELIEKGTEEFGKKFKEIAGWIGNELTDNCDMGELVDIVQELQIEYYD